MNLRCAFYGDDFTGATDTLATLSREGLATFLFLGVPSALRRDAVGPLDSLGIAGAARSMGAAAMRSELAPVVDYFASLVVPVLHYKCCSTFDSSPTIGNLAVALRECGRAAKSGFVPIVGGQPSLTRYCAFGHLFASAGDGEVHRIDRHPTMSRHPVTPMRESDLGRHLASQGLERVARVDFRTVDAGDAALEARVTALLEGGSRPILFDVTRQEQLVQIGRVIWERAMREPLLVLGASSVAQALIAYWRANGSLAPTAPPMPIRAASGPVFALAGSQSPITAAQVTAGLTHFQGVPLDVVSLVQRPEAIESLAGACARWLRQERNVLAYAGAVCDGGPEARDVARAFGRLLQRVLELSPGTRRIGLAGGDTSSLAVQALDLWGLSFVGDLAPGVSLVRARSDSVRLDGLELMLKGGQMGPADVFQILVGGSGSI